MTVEELRARLAPRNLRDGREKRERLKQNVLQKLAREGKELSEFLPKDLVARFEHEVLFRRLGLAGENSELQRLLTHWRAVQRLIKEVKMHPDQWCDSPEVVYAYFITKRFSLSYAEKLLRILNNWGLYVAKHSEKRFWPVAAPKGRMRERIADAYYSKTKRGKKSASITPQQLANARPDLKDGQYNFLFVSIWFGLRPAEIEQFKSYNEDLWRIENRQGLDVLWVYQPKLTSLPRDERWKLIPVLFAEQKQALDFIRSGRVERPLPKTIRRWVNPHANNYGGRKGFHALMRERDQIFEDISAWLGHASLDRTWRDYRERLKLSVGGIK